MIEIETKILDVNIFALKKKLKAKKAKFKGKVLLKRWVFLLAKKEAEENFIRVRTDGKISTLTYKHRKGKGLRNTQEVETKVESFDKAVKILSSVISKKYYRENTRETYNYKDLEITINKYPDIPAYVEIEGPSEKRIYGCIKELEIKGKVIGNVGMAKLYRFYNKNSSSLKVQKFKLPRAK